MVMHGQKLQQIADRRRTRTDSSVMTKLLDYVEKREPTLDEFECYVGVNVTADLIISHDLLPTRAVVKSLLEAYPGLFETDGVRWYSRAGGWRSRWRAFQRFWRWF